MSVNVVVIGGGYAGVMAANRVAASRTAAGIQVMLVTADAAFVERIRLHELAAGSTGDVEVPYSTLLHPGIRLEVARVGLIDGAAREVSLVDGARLPYDYLIYAVGSGGRHPEGDGVHSLADAQAAARLRAALRALPAGATVAVVGGGLTAAEAATEVAEQHPSLTVRLHTAGEVAPSVSEASRNRLRRRFERTGMELAEGARVDTTGDVRTALGADLVVWCTGFRVPPLAADSGLPITQDGRLRVDATLAVTHGGGIDPSAGHGPRIFGAGDAALIDDPRYSYHRMSCASALPMGAHAADNVLRLIAGRNAEPIDTGFLAQCLSLGRRDALIQPVTPEDRPRRFALTGRIAAVGKEGICRQTLRWLRGEARRGGSYSWPKGPSLPEQKNTTTAADAAEETVWS